MKKDFAYAGKAQYASTFVADSNHLRCAFQANELDTLAWSVVVSFMKHSVMQSLCISQTHISRAFKQCVTLFEMLKDTLLKSANPTSIRVKGRCVLSSTAF